MTTELGTRSPRRTLSSMSTNSTSLLSSISNVDYNKPAVVIEIGAKLTKCGFAGEFSPRAVLRTEFIDDSLTVRRDMFEKAQADQNDIAALHKFFKHIFFNHLLTIPRERRVVIVESVLCPSRIRHAIATVLIEKLDAPSILFAPSHLLATFPFNAPDALVIDMGYTETVALPIVEGVTVLTSWAVSAVGARKLEQRVRQLISSHGRLVDEAGEERALTQQDMHDIDAASLCEDIAVRFCFVSSMSRSAVLREGVEAAAAAGLRLAKDVRLPIGTRTLIVPGYVREMACEVLFCDGDDDDDHSLPHILHDMVAKCPMDTRRRLFSRLLPVGGPSLLRGFNARLAEEIKHMAQQRGVRTADEVKFLRFDEQPQAGLYTSWLGGAMFASLQDILPQRSVSREDWLENRKLPDWTDFCSNPSMYDPLMIRGR